MILKSFLKQVTTNIIAVSYLLVFSIMPILLLSQLSIYYSLRFEANDAYNNFTDDFTLREIQANFDDVLAYIRPPFNTQLDSQFFSEQDILHMQDVRGLFQFLYVLLGVTLGIIVLKLIFEKSVLRMYNLQVYLTKTKNFLGLLLTLLAIIAIASTFWWKELFTWFHKIVFPMNEYWMLDPETSNLIKYFDNSIFFELFVIYVIIIGICFLFLRLYSKN